MDMLPLEIAEKLVTTLQVEGRAFIRWTLVDGVPALKVLTHEDMHCPTCQCNKFPPTPPVPENPRSRSWHENALTAPPK